MALVWMSGFEWGTKLELTTADGGVSVTNSRSRGGVYSLTYGNGQHAYKTLPGGPYSEFYIQCAILYPSSHTHPVIGLLGPGGNYMFSVCRNASGVLHFCLGNEVFPGLVVGQTPILNNVWYVVEAHVIVSDVSGLVEFRVDGNLEGTFIGDTKVGADTGVSRLHWGHTTGTGGNYADDVVFFDATGPVNNTWPNGVKIILLRPVGDAGQNEWTPSVPGNHYALVDERPPNNADWLKGMAQGEIERFRLEQLPAEALTVKCVQADFWGVKGAMLPPDKLKLGFDIEGTPYMSDEMNTMLSQAQASWLCNQNPAGGNWTSDAVNNLNLVLEARGA